MTSPPAASIVMPVFNAARYIALAVRSVLLQSSRDFELIIADDGSTDGSIDAALREANGDPRVRVISSPNNRGLNPTLKAAFAGARGRYLGTIDSDDLLAGDALRDCAALLDAKPEVGMVYTDHIIIDEAGRALGLGKRCTIPYSPERLLIDFMTFHFRLIRRTAFDAAGGIDETFTTAGDYDLCLRLSECTKIEHLPRPLYAYRQRSGQVSTARRVEQIESSARAIRAAMARRGLDRTSELEVEIVGRFSVRPRPLGG